MRASSITTQLTKPHPAGVRYQYTTITDAIEWVLTQEEELTNAYFKNVVDHDPDEDPQGPLWGEALSFLRHALNQDINDRMLRSCQGYEENGQYPRILISDCALFLLGELNVRRMAEEWWKQKFVRREGDRLNFQSYLQERVGFLRGGFGRIAPARDYFSRRRFHLKKTFTDRRLRDLYHGDLSDQSRRPKKFATTKQKNSIQNPGNDIAVILEWANQKRKAKGKKPLTGGQFLNIICPQSPDEKRERKGKNKNYTESIVEHYELYYSGFNKSTKSLIQHFLLPSLDPMKNAHKNVNRAFRNGDSISDLLGPAPLPDALKKFLKPYI